MVSIDIPPHPWWKPGLDLHRGGDSYAHLLSATRGLLDAVAGVDAPEAVLAEVAGEVSRIAGRLNSYTTSDESQIAGTRMDLPGRGHPLVVPYRTTSWTSVRMTAEVTFTRIHLGDGGAVHGGVTALLFDEVLGRFANHGRQPARTAFLHVNYRRLVPLDVDLDILTKVDRAEGRKLYITAELSHDGTVLADAEGLFVAVSAQ
ncbi:thioesterase superfamily protein [Saccharopolyspora spinosa]|uniref:Acyl-coenzyme A thioesterase THEM4 n=1 Tax=Saccharopolyspora spinosa TaxID=60894 RepID=A0A2N3Y3G5_SACSN|nr:thioesterase superfamily protein [Saccharopolyspora spinosa]